MIRSIRVKFFTSLEQSSSPQTQGKPNHITRAHSHYSNPSQQSWKIRSILFLLAQSYDTKETFELTIRP